MGLVDRLRNDRPGSVSNRGDPVLFRGEVVIFLTAGGSTVAGAGIFSSQYISGPFSEVLLFAFLYIGFPLAALLAGVVLARSSFNEAERRVAALWYLGGLGFLVVLIVWANLPEYRGGASLRGDVATFVLFGNLGGILGLIAGFNRARAAQNERLKRIAETRREQIAFVNRLLRHNILNHVQVISGYAQLGTRTVEDIEREDLDVIGASSERISEIIDDVRILINSLEGNIEIRPIDISPMLQAQADLVQERYPETEVSVRIPDELVVQGNSALSTVFENVLENAIIHNDREVPQVSVQASIADDTAEICIADNGPGIPQDLIARYLEAAVPAEGKGDSLGLYLVSRMVTMVNGDVRVEENEPRGSIVVISLPVEET